MSKAAAKPVKSSPGKAERPSKDEYKERLYALQIELVKLQRHFISNNEKILVLVEGRDAAGKDGVIKCITEHLSPRETRVVALSKPSDRESSQWYFQRYVPHLPASQEFVLFNRSWYNRAGVERVMGFCTEQQVDEFFDNVMNFEAMLVRSGIRFFKYYLDINRETQKRRMEERHVDPLKQWKVSPIDAKALQLFDKYSAARNDMLMKTRSPLLPWLIVRADEKRAARLNMIADLLARIDYEGKDRKALQVDPAVVFEFKEIHLTDGSLAP